MYIKRGISENLTTFTSPRFAYKSKSKSSLRHRVTLGIGGNVGDVKRRFEHLFVILKRETRVSIVETSLILKNPPFGFLNQDDFFNSIIILQTNMQPLVFLDYLMRLEKKFGRRRSFANAPRTLDLDIIFFDSRVISKEKLTIPHASWQDRESVVIPLAGIE